MSIYVYVGWRQGDGEGLRETPPYRPCPCGLALDSIQFHSFPANQPSLGISTAEGRVPWGLGVAVRDLAV